MKPYVDRAESTLVLVMACPLFGIKPSYKPMLIYHQMNPQEYNSMKLKSRYNNILSGNCIWKCHLQNGSHFVQASLVINELYYIQTANKKHWMITKTDMNRKNEMVNWRPPSMFKSGWGFPGQCRNGWNKLQAQVQIEQELYSQPGGQCRWQNP